MLNPRRDTELRQHPHVLLCPLPAQGHVNPFLNLATLLTSKGIAVSFISAEHRISPLRSNEYLLNNPLLRLVGIPERVPQGDIAIDQGFDGFIWEKSVIDNMKDDFVEFVKLLREDTTANSSYGAPDCIVADVFTAWSVTVAAELNLSLYILYTGPAWCLTGLIRLPILTKQGLIPLKSSAPPQLMCLPGLPPLWNTDILHYMMDVVPAEIRELALNSALVQSQSSRILLNTSYEIERVYIDALEKEDPYKTNLRILPIGPLLLFELPNDSNGRWPLSQLELNKATKEVKACFEWLNTQSAASVLYVSFGSMYIPSEEEILQLALGLEASNHPFLWILRQPPYDPSKDAESWLGRILPQGFQTRTQAKGFILSQWAPQKQILSHPSIGCFWTHCGWNSILESICCGVPMIAYPQFADQRQNCRMIVDELQWAVEIRKDEAKGYPERGTVEEVIRRAMEGEESDKIRREVERARGEMIKSVKEKSGSSFRNVEMIVQDIYNIFHQSRSQ